MWKEGRKEILNTIISNTNTLMSFVMVTVVPRFLFSNVTCTFSPAKEDPQIHFCIFVKTHHAYNAAKRRRKKNKRGTWNNILSSKHTFNVLLALKTLLHDKVIFISKMRFYHCL